MIKHRPFSVMLLGLTLLAPAPSVAICSSLFRYCLGHCLYEGLYVGGGLGYDFFNTEENIKLTNQAGIPVFTSEQTLDTSGPMGRMVFGYGQYYDWFYIAGEIFTSYADAKTSQSIHSFPTYKTDMDVHWGYGFGILPGIRLNLAFLLYSRVDYLRTYMKTRETSPLIGESTKWDGNTGFDLGIGLETSLIPYATRFPSFSLRAEYTHANYGSSESLVKTKFDSGNNQFILELIYHFCNP